MYDSVSYAIIGWNNALSYIGHQAITWTNDSLLSIGPHEQT